MPRQDDITPFTATALRCSALTGDRSVFQGSGARDAICSLARDTRARGLSVDEVLVELDLVLDAIAPCAADSKAAAERREELTRWFIESYYYLNW